MSVTSAYASQNVGTAVYDVTNYTDWDFNYGNPPTSGPKPESEFFDNGLPKTETKNADVACTAGGPVTSVAGVPTAGGVITLKVPAGRLPGGGFISTEMVVVRPYIAQDTARFGDSSITNIDSTDTDTEADFVPLLKFCNAGG
jgi:hypothetical protein